MNLNEFKPFLGLIIFGNIENLVLSSQGVIEGANPLVVALASLVVVFFWFSVGTFGTKVAMKYSRYIEFIGGLAIFILGIQSMMAVIKTIV